jgi:hypothetical protein
MIGTDPTKQGHGFRGLTQRVEVFDAGEDAAAHGLLVDDPEPDLDEVQPGVRRRGEMDAESWMNRRHIQSSQSPNNL